MNRVCKTNLDMVCLNSIANDLALIGFCKNSKAYTYMCHAIFFAVQDSKNLSSISSKVFSKVAEFYNTKPANIEKACRHSLDAVYFDGNICKVNDVLGIKYLKPYEKPHLTTFISLLAEKHFIQLNKLILHREKQRKYFKRTLKINIVLNLSKIFLIKKASHELSL